jgi:enediyne biosynthesis protein E4
MSARRVTIGLALLLVLSGCGWLAPTVPTTQFVPPAPTSLVPVRVSATPLVRQATCSGAFVAHTLDSATVVAGDAVRLFDSNGAGVAIGDLDEDGRPDLVFANLDGPDTIFWNQGDFTFRKETIDDTNSRAVNIVDVDGDGLLDIVFTHRAGSVSYWRNDGRPSSPQPPSPAAAGEGGVSSPPLPLRRETSEAQRAGWPGGEGQRFVREPLPGVLDPANAMAWGDLNGDGALDLVTGSYDSELAKRNANAFLLSDGAGVYYYQQRSDGTFAPQRLARAAQALAIALPDINGDGRPDILIGNDFTMPDATWLRQGDRWQPAQPFAAMAESTMSFDQGDIDNDGRLELFATDMKPYDVRTQTLASWLPMMATMPQTHAPDDPQIMENVLQVRGADGAFHNQAYGRGASATGWSWSGKFGDLDNDGFLDLYVVNGMIAAELFHHLPGDELVERNQALRNQGDGTFAPSPAWGLGSSASGRGMSMADLDGDGDLDIVVNNLRAPAQLFENRLCGGSGLEVELRWPSSQNSRAIGTQLVLHTSSETYYRDVRTGSGYLSGDPAQVHFGFPASAVIQRLEIRWPDDAISWVEGPGAQTVMTITRS